MASSTMVKFCAMLCTVMVALAPHTEALITCGQVATSVAPCMPYLRGVNGPSGACCSGITRLNRMAQSTPDKKSACTCLQSAARAMTGLNFGLAAGLPAKCGVHISYPISLTTDCTKIH